MFSKKIILIIAIVCIAGAIISFSYYLLKQPEEISEDLIEEDLTEDEIADELEALREVNLQAIDKVEQAYIHDPIPISEADHIDGNLEAPVKIIIYSSFACSFCVNFYDTAKEIKEYFNDQVIIAFRHYFFSPSSFSYTTAMAAECASEQGKFWEMYDALYTSNKENKLNSAEINRQAVELGLEEIEFNKCLQTEKYKDKIEEQVFNGKNAGAYGTPTIFVNDQILPGAYPFEDFTHSDGRPGEGMKTIIEKQLRD